MSGAFIVLYVFQTKLSAEKTGCSAREPVYETFLTKCFHFKKFILWMKFRYMSKLLGKYPNHQTNLSLWKAMMASNINNLHSQYQCQQQNAILTRLDSMFNMFCFVKKVNIIICHYTETRRVPVICTQKCNFSFINTN